jgi:putative ABC transport system permease protein
MFIMYCGNIGHLANDLSNDLRYALRGFRRNPIFTLTAVFAIVLGIGATTAVFSVVDRILFRRLPYPDDARLVSVGIVAPSLDSNEFLFADSLVRWRRNQTPFAGIASFNFIVDCDLTERNPARLRCARVDSSFLPTFGIQPLAGRNFTREEDLPNAPKVALLFYGFWRSRMGGDTGAIGKSISIDGQTTTIVGVLPRDFELFNLSHADLLVPEALNEAAEHSGQAFRVFARLKPGVTLQQATARMQPLFARDLLDAAPEFRRELKLVIRPLRDRQIQNARLASWVLLGGVIAVLLIACANVANLLLARSAMRRRELAVRAAIGAGRARLVRQAITESLLLAFLGAAGGCLFAWGLLRVFIAIAPGGIPRLEQATLDARVLLFALAACLLAGVLFGLAPAFESPRVEALVGGRAIGSPRGIFRQMLVAAQIAVSLLLLTGASLLLRSLWKLESVPLGVDTDNVLTAHFVLGRGYARDARQLGFFEELEARLKRLPGAAAVAISDSIPPSGGTLGRPFSDIGVEGRPPLAERAGGMVAWRYVTPGYFAALGIPILRGRPFREEDRQPAGYAVILSETLARRLFPFDDPLGKHVLKTARGQWFAVVGIAGDVRNVGPARAADPEYYVVRKHVPDETFQNEDDGWHSASVVIRSPLNSRAMAVWLRAEFAAMDATLPVEVETMRQRVGELAERPRFNAMLLTLFAAMGMLLAGIGLYGVLGFLVTLRTQEIGVRMALGATPAGITMLLLGQAAVWALAGAGLGLSGSLFAMRVLRSLLFEVPERDPWALIAAPVLLLLVALIAAWIPSRRAARVDPMQALRQE